MSTDTYRELAQRAAKRHGVFTKDDVAELGISRASLARGIRSGRFAAPSPGVYIVSGSPDTALRRIAIAVHSVPSLSAVSHRTAAELWGLTDRGIRTIEVLTLRWDRVRRSGIRVHESRDLIAEDIVIHENLPVTTPARTVVDLGAVNPWLVESALETGVRQGLVTVAEVEAFVERVARRGRRGVGVVRPLLEARRRWDGATESALEDLFLKTLSEQHVPMPVAQYIVRDDRNEFVCRADFAYPTAHVLIELDSERHHLDRLAFRRDRAKQNRAVVLGWTVLRFTWWDLQQDPYGAVAQIRGTLANSRMRPVDRRLAMEPALASQYSSR